MADVVVPSGGSVGPVGKEDAKERSAAPAWTRKYPPLLGLLVALAIALTVLPSSLNLQQPNPTETLEFAPVPPDDDDPPPPPQGNFANLGLGSSSGLDGGAPDGGEEDSDAIGDPPDLPPPAIGTNPVTKRCVGNPPRQTEDPLSPPCSAFFDGDNFGATYQGVTGDEIRLLYYINGFVAELGGSEGREPRPVEKYFDLFEPPDPDDDDSDHLILEALRVWQRYFNERFQTYGRQVHFFVYFHGADAEVENKRADAADNYNTVKPFAIISETEENEDAYLQAMAQKGVLNFGSLFGRPGSFFETFPKLIWGFSPSLEQQSEQYASYVCAKVAPFRSALNGNSDQNPGPDTGDPRKYGIIQTSDRAYPGLLLLADLVREKAAACGVEIAATGTFPACCYAKDNSENHSYANVQMAQFQEAGITTILWTGGINGYYGPAADSIGYEPEWIVLGDYTLDAHGPVKLATLTGAFDGRAVIVSPATFEPALTQQICYAAFREVDQTYPNRDLYFTCPMYKNIFQFFTGVQVAGPRLGPTSIDEGFHAIPAVRSENPQVPACFYLPNDYTCVKDAEAMIWDADGPSPGDSRPGCWRAIEGGKRYLPGEWPEGNIDAQITGDEPCNGYTRSVLLRTV